MKEFLPYIAPLIALYIIIRRGSRPRRIRPNGLWIYPLIITVLAASALSHSKAPDLLGYGLFVVAALAGAALGWFTTQHVELTLDEKTGTIMSKPTQFGTILTAAVFVARFAIEFMVNGNPNGMPSRHVLQAHHADSLLLFANAGLVFVAGRILLQAAHMWLRVRPLVAQHKASQ
ncbi:MAG: DUF1453 family protein [Proteobacteria bacterium]|nr:DUF1453 family protein [Pseudomonadota bacterium]